MKRITYKARENWQKAVESQGLGWHTPYWNEEAYYSLTPADVKAIKDATEELYAMFLEAGRYDVRPAPSESNRLSVTRSSTSNCRAGSW